MRIDRAVFVRRFALTGHRAGRIAQTVVVHYGPVGTGEVYRVRKVRMIKLVFDLRTGHGGIQQLRFALGVLAHKRRVAACRLTLGGKDVVDRAVRVGRKRQIVVAGFEDIGPVAERVITLHVRRVERQRNGLALTGLQQLRFGKVRQIHARLFYAVVDVILRIGRLVVQLRDFLARERAGVGDLHGDGDLAVRFG